VLDGYRALLDHADQLEREDPVSKGSFFALSAESARRPEVRRHHDRLDRLDAEGRVLLTEGGTPSGDEYDTVWRVVPPFGPFPRALSETYPLTATVPERPDAAAQRAAAEGVRRVVAANPGADFVLAHEGWADAALALLPEGVVVESLAGRGDPGDGRE
jgi:7-cyano-7-deazaguanine tRNA-ribosyltransferase